MSTSHWQLSRSSRTSGFRFATPGGVRTWLAFGLQLLAIEAFEVGDDVFRGNIHPPDAAVAVRHAHQLIHIEQTLGIFVEPSLQLWAGHVHGLFGLLSYGTISAITNVVYALGQTLVPLVLAIWIVRAHPLDFPLVRSIALLTVVLGVLGYELYPLAPPRLTGGIMDGGHAFHFQNSTAEVIGTAKLNGIPIGYNAYSAMPSLHIAMALIVAGSLLLLSRSVLVRGLAGLYPVLMLFTVVVSGNHYLLDVMGGVLVVALATVMVLVLEPGHRHLARLAHPAAPSASTTVRSGHVGTVSEKGSPVSASRTDPLCIAGQSTADEHADRMAGRIRAA